MENELYSQQYCMQQQLHSAVETAIVSLSFRQIICKGPPHSTAAECFYPDMHRRGAAFATSTTLPSYLATLELLRYLDALFILPQKPHPLIAQLYITHITSL